MNKPMRASLAAMIGLAFAVVPTTPGLAQSGNRTPVEVEGTFVVNDLCDFSVTVTAHVDGSETVVDTGTGSIQRSHLNETDIFRANGNTLEGSYTFQLKVNLDKDGNVVSGYQTGVIVRVPLPNGDSFKVSGRADAINAQTDYIITPTHGVTRNLAEFCGYLAA